ncbi:MAG: DegT/DnrJ/EryC1/StrS family aminotransferase [Phycisphaerae bacterium]|nr:DegT/DnrJ/EryC1/StrS family aminotransferase [Phycisphaerae bacterium]
MHVKYSYLEEQFAEPKPILDAIERLVRTADYTLGKPVEEFERRFAEVIGTKYAVGVNSGTDALFLSLKAAGIGPGDEIITVPNTFIATVGAIVAAGAKPVFVDVLEDDFTVNPELIESAITPRTRAIMPVHYAGHPAEMPDILAIAEKHSLLVVEDACQAIGAEIAGRRVGTFGLAAGFSLHPLKNLNVWGDGGVIVTSNKAIRDRLILLRNHGLENRDEVQIFGYNSRLDSLQAVVGNCLIGDIEKVTETRIKWAGIYDQALADLKEYITIPRRKDGRRYVYHLYMLKVQRRDELLAYLNEREIEAKIHYPVPLHLQAAARDLGYKEGDFPVAEAQTRSILTLPVHQHLTAKQVEYVIETIQAFYR